MAKPAMRPEDWGFPGFLSADQEAALAALRTEVVANNLFPKDAVMPDRHLLRFLRARQFDPAKALSMLQVDLAWRREFEGRLFKAHEMPSLIEFCKNEAMYRAGSDKDGRPVLVMNMAKFYPREIKDLNEIVLFWVAYVHRLTEACESAGHTDYTIIADLAGFSPSANFSLALIKVMVNILQNFYPERLGYCFVLNLPSAFRMGWNMIAPLLDERTKAKLHMVAPKTVTQTLSEYIPKDQLEKAFGGTHPNYPRPDEWTKELMGDGILVETGYFKGVAAPVGGGAPMERRKSGRVRSILRSLSKRVMAQSLTKDVPKTAPRAAVFGATGRSGVLLVKALLDKGVDVSVFVRQEGSGIPPLLLQHRDHFGKDRLQIVVGKLDDEDDVDRTVESSDYVITCISHAVTKPEQAADFESSFKAILDSMERNGSKRIVMISSANASEALWESGSDVLTNIARNVQWSSKYKHLANVEKAVMVTDLEWTIVRPNALTDDVALEAPQVQEDAFFVGGAISRKQLADFAVEIATGNKYIKKGLAVGSKAQ